MTQVNRTLDDRHFDRIDHALGRPVHPMRRDNYRNHYAIDINSPEASGMASSPHWHVGKRSGDLLFFHVTDHGRRALSDHLKSIGDKHRLWVIKWDGMELFAVATSRSKARYIKWLSVSDTCDISFRDFCATAQVGLAT